jgi:predicted nucleotidyltransferase
MEEAIEEIKEVTNGVRINGEEVHSIQFSDDIALMAESEDNTNLILNTLPRVMDKLHMKINTTKTKTMTARRDQIYTNSVIKLNDTIIQEVEQFPYLGSIITYNNTSTIDIKKRITLAK